MRTYTHNTQLLSGRGIFDHRRRQIDRAEREYVSSRWNRENETENRSREATWRSNRWFLLLIHNCSFTVAVWVCMRVMDAFKTFFKLIIPNNLYFCFAQTDKSRGGSTWGLKSHFLTLSYIHCVKVCNSTLQGPSVSLCIHMYVCVKVHGEMVCALLSQSMTNMQCFLHRSTHWLSVPWCPPVVALCTGVALGRIAQTRNHTTLSFVQEASWLASSLD